MIRMIRIRNVAETLHRTLKAKAATSDISLSDYLLGELQEIAERPTMAEFRDRLHTHAELTVLFDTADLVREERAAR
jgi:hypothetical protein